MSYDNTADGSSKSPENGSCPRAGIPESDTGESGEESEPTYRHYDNFETDVCLTQDEDDDPTDRSSGVVKDLGQNLQPVGNGLTKPSSVDSRDMIPNGNNLGVVNGINRGLSSDSDSCTESELTQGQGQVTDDTTTTSTSESEETQIWVPVSKRPSTRQMQDTTTDQAPSATSSNGSDHSRPQSYIRKAGSPAPTGAVSLSYVSSPSGIQERNSRAGSHDGVRRDSRDSWHTIQSNLQSSGVNKRVSPAKQMSVGLLRHDEATGTITLDIRNVPNGDSGLGQEDGHYMNSEDTLNTGGVNVSMLNGKTARATENRFGQNMSFTECICVLWSGLYMLFVVVAGMILPLAEVFVQKPCPVLFEGFYIYLYVMSITFLVYAYTYLLRISTLSVSRRGRTIVSSVPVQNRKRNPYVNDVMKHQTGTFYLRLGAVFFGIGSMIKSGLQVGEYFEMSSTPNCGHVLLGIRPILNLCFTFGQLYFVFLNSKMLIHRYRYLARFGLMHMIATNAAVWFEDIVKETLRELGRAHTDTILGNISNEDNSNNLKVVEGYDDPHCQGESRMGEVVDMSSPYLYPCSVVYSIVCASVLFAMWSNLDKPEGKVDRPSEQSVSQERSNVDCSSSSRGLFLGIFIFVAAVIILITFFVLVQTEEFMNTAVRLDHLGDVAIFVITIISLILAFHRTHGLRYLDHDEGPGFEDALLVISLLGVYVLCMSNIIAGILTNVEHYGQLIVLSSSLRCVQGTIQTMYLLNTMRKRVWKREHEENKTGREFVTFLLICNIALWGMSIFEVQRSEANPVQEKFYGHVAWNIITHVSVPFAIFYRFHSTVCLANIWKHAWMYRS